MSNKNLKFLVKSAIIAALYVVLTWVLSPISYGAIQFRLSEVLVLLVLFNKKYSIALILGCFIANTTSPLGWYDMVFGTLATTIAIIPMLFIKKPVISAIFPVISNAFIVAIELGFAFDLFMPEAFWYNVLTIALGEAVVLYFVGIPLFYAIAKSEKTTEILELDFSHINANNELITKEFIISIILGALSIILFIAYPIYEGIEIVDEKEAKIAYSGLKLAMEKNSIYLVLMVIPTLLIGIYFVPNKLIALISSILVSLGLIILLIIFGINNIDAFKYGYYYLYFVFPILIIIFGILSFKNNKEIEIEE